MFNFFEILQLYMVPFAFAVPVVLIVLFFAFRRPDAPKIPDIAASYPEPVAPVVPEADRIQFNIEASDPAERAGPETVPVDPRFGLEGPAVVLVVDDSAVPRTKLKKLFEGQGYKVETAGDGVEALDLIGKTRVDVVVTDLEMPNMDGFELIAAIQGSMETEDLPIIAITGHEELSARVHVISGLYGIFKKPWNDRELIKRIGALSTLRKKAAA